MPVLAAIKKQFAKEKPFAGMTIGMALHVEAKTANLVATLAAGGAVVHITGCNPLSTQDDVSEALNTMKNVHCYAKRGCTVEEYYAAIDLVLDAEPVITIDDGMDLIHYLHTKRRDQLKNVIGGCEETTTGIHRLRSMAAEGNLEFPVVAVNDTPMKHFFDNVHGTGESSLTSIIDHDKRPYRGKIRGDRRLRVLRARPREESPRPRCKSHRYRDRPAPGARGPYGRVPGYEHGQRGKDR